MGSAVGIRRLFVANRGEIAVRIIRAAQALDIETVVGVSEADRDSMGATTAGHAVCIGSAPAAESYLNMEAIVAAARDSGCDAVHPGYGFLAERSAFPRLCDERGLTFVGPSADVIDALGDKLKARCIATHLGVPVVPGTGHVKSVKEAMEFGEQAGYPFLLKASAGGGGRGMRIVRALSELAAGFEGASAEARASFGDSTLYIERYIERARHVEVQIIGDGDGHLVHLGERDCSTQRRHQKLIEEAPSPIIDEELRSALVEAAVRLTKHVGYTNAGTVEFVLDLDAKTYYFLEINTRIQVEHPVTEMVTGLDLVVEQIRVAGGMPLSVEQEDLRVNGHAIECRINAERPERGFLPSPGTILAWEIPTGAGIRVDSHCYPGYRIPPFYDSLVAKLIVHGPNRKAAIARMSDALAAFKVSGIHTTIPFHQEVLAHADFQESRVTTRWVEETFTANHRTQRTAKAK